MLTRINRVGLALFTIYLLLYGGFVLLNTFWPSAMEWKPLAGVNLAVLYGFGLIAAAFVLALLYGGLGRPSPVGPAAGGAAVIGGRGESGVGERANDRHAGRGEHA